MYIFLGGGGGGLEGNFGTGVRPSFFKPTLIVYLVLDKNNLLIFLIEQNVYIFIIIYCSLTFAVCKQSLQTDNTILVSELNI